MVTRKKIFISLIGFPRSGTTFIARNLSQARGVAYWEEPKYIWKYRQRPYGFDDARCEPVPDVCEYIKGRFEKFLGEDEIFLEKTPSNVFRIEAVRKILPEGKLIFVFRNPVDVLRSYEKKQRGPVDWSVVKRRLLNRDFPIRDYVQILKSVVLDVLPMTRGQNWGIRLSNATGLTGKNKVLFYWILSAKKIIENYELGKDVLVDYDQYIRSVNNETQRIARSLGTRLEFERELTQNSKSVDREIKQDLSDVDSSLHGSLLEEAWDVFEQLRNLETRERVNYESRVRKHGEIIK